MAHITPQDSSLLQTLQIAMGTRIPRKVSHLLNARSVEEKPAKQRQILRKFHATIIRPSAGETAFAAITTT